MSHLLRILAATRPWLAGLALAALLAACVGDGRLDGGERSVLGGWELAADSQCTQQLVLRGDGSFGFAAHIRSDGLGAGDALQGSFTGPERAGPGHPATLQFTPDAAPASSALLYCRQWQALSTLALPWEALSPAGGLEPQALSYRAVPLAGRGNLLVGSGTDRHDHLALYPGADGALHGFSLDDPGLYPDPLYYVSPDAPEAMLTGLSVVPVRPVPRQVFSQVFPEALAGGTMLARMYLNVTMAVDVTFSTVPGSDLPACNFATYTDISFASSGLSGRVAQGIDSQVVTYNPAATGDDLVPYTLGSATFYLVPLIVSSLEAKGCAANVRARPTVARLALEREAQGLADPLQVALPEGQPYLGASDAARPGRLFAVPLAGGTVPWEDFQLTGTLYAPPPPPPEDAPPDFDVLHLLASDAPGPELSVGQGDEAAYLNAYAAADARTGLGPFQAHAAPSSATTVALPASMSVTIGGSGGRYRFELPGPERVAASASGADLSGALVDDTGWVWAADPGNGNGFSVARTLPAGRYDLRVTARQFPATATLSLEVPTSASPVADERLEGCLVTAGLRGSASPADVAKALCEDLGIQGLDGLESFSGLTVLGLARNRVTTLAPLAALSRLRVLELSSNPVGDLAPLQALTMLFRLSLADTALDADQLAVLRTLRQLRYLDLSDAQGLEPADVDQLRASLPNTVIVDPLGQIGE